MLNAAWLTGQVPLKRARAWESSVDGIGKTLRAIDFALDLMGIPCGTVGLAGRTGIARTGGAPASALRCFLSLLFMNSAA
jgi:hypothetical protein